MASESTGTVVPTFLTKEFLKKTLENGLKTLGIVVQDFAISQASAPGENFTSELFRVCVVYKSPQKDIQKIYLIVKNVQLEGTSRQILRENDVFQNEVNFYTEFLPEMERILGSSTIGPKCFAVDEEETVLVLADLNALGYELEDRILGLDEAHCEIILKKMAQFHAASMYMAKQDSKLLQIFNKSPFKNFVQSEHFAKYFTRNFQNTINLVKSWPTYEAIAKKLERIIVNLLPKCNENIEVKDGEILVLLHNDLWVNNAMFKYCNGSKTPSDVVLLDFQAVNSGSLGKDIQYFLNTSVQLEVLKSKRYKLIGAYYDTLKSTLEHLKYTPVPSWEDVRKEIRARELFGVFIMACELPLVCIEKHVSGNFNIENFNENSKEVHEAMFASKRVQETFKYCLRRFDDLGVLDEQ